MKRKLLMKLLPLFLSMVFLFLTIIPCFAYTSCSDEKFTSIHDVIATYCDGNYPTWFSEEYSYFCFFQNPPNIDSSTVVIYGYMSEKLSSENIYTLSPLYSSGNYSYMSCNLESNNLTVGKFIMAKYNTVKGTYYTSNASTKPILYGTSYWDKIPYILYADGDVFYYDTPNNTKDLVFDTNIITDISNFNDYCIKKGFGEFPYYDKDYVYSVWVHPDLNKLFVDAFPRSLLTSMPVWIDTDSQSGEFLITYDWSIESSSKSNVYFWNRDTKTWGVGTFGQKSFSTQPQYLYSDYNIHSLVDGTYYCTFQKTSSSADTGGSGGGSGDTDSSLDADSHKGLLETIIDNITGGFSSLGKSFTNSIGTVHAIVKTISEFQATINANLLQGFKDVVNGITTGFENVLVKLFKPTFTPFTELHELMQEKIPIAGQLYGLLGAYIAVLNEFDYVDYVPEVTMNINYYGFKGEVDVFDVSWYEPYRDTVNAILSVFMWLVFGISAYKSIPKLLGGIT